MTFQIAPLLLPLFALGVHIARSQISLAACEGDGYAWSFNSKSQSPCDMVALLMAICQGSNFTVDPLSGPDDIYQGPRKEDKEPACSCGTVTWSLFSACAACQNGTLISWSRWAYNCSNVDVSSFPYDIPSGTAIPDWAYLRVGGDDLWNVTAARLDLGRPEHTPGGSDGGSKNGSANMIGPIVGGAVGGVAVLAILVVWIVFARRRHIASQRPPSSLHGPQGTSPYRMEPAPHSPTSPGYGTEPSMGQKLYDPSDPNTYPSPLNYEYFTGTTHTTMLDGHPYRQQPHQTSLSPNRYTNPQ